MIPKGLVQLVHQSDVPAVVADAAAEDCPLVVVNKAFCDMSGYSSEELIGVNCRFLQPPIDADLVRKRIRAFLADDSLSQGEFVIPNARKDGSRFLNLLHLSKLSRSDRAPLIFGSQFDITTRSTDELASYNASLRYHTRLIGKLVEQSGWSMTQPHAALADSLDRIAQYEL